MTAYPSPPLNEEILSEIRERCDATTPGPWRARVEKREGFSGSDFIETNAQDIEISGATEADYDFIAQARQDIPRLLAEVARLRAALTGG